MKGEQKVIQILNEVLASELTAISQYFVHAMMCENWGYQRLARVTREESLGEMKHAEELIERILYLEGIPNVQKPDKVRIGEKPADQLKHDMELETGAIERLNRGIAVALEVGDNGTRELLEELLKSEEEHLNFLETQLGLIKQLGEVNYLTQQLREKD